MKAALGVVLFLMAWTAEAGVEVKLSRKVEPGGSAGYHLTCEGTAVSCKLEQLRNQKAFRSVNVERKKADSVVADFVGTYSSAATDPAAGGKTHLEFLVKTDSKELQGKVRGKQKMDHALVVLEAELSSLMTKLSPHQEKSK